MRHVALNRQPDFILNVKTIYKPSAKPKRLRSQPKPALDHCDRCGHGITLTGEEVDFKMGMNGPYISPRDPNSIVCWTCGKKILEEIAKGVSQ